jgi:hypothetical protein
MQEIVWSYHLVLYGDALVAFNSFKGVRVATAIEYGLIAALIGVVIVYGIGKIESVTKSWMNPPAVTQPADK